MLVREGIEAVWSVWSVCDPTGQKVFGRHRLPDHRSALVYPGSMLRLIWRCRSCNGGSEGCSTLRTVHDLHAHGALHFEVRWCYRTRCSRRPDMVTNACFETDLPCCMSVPRRAEILPGRGRDHVDIPGDGGSKVPAAEYRPP